MPKRTLLASVFAIAMLSPLTALAMPFANLFVFGDSLVDTGNAQSALLDLGGPDVAPASLGYFEGRFSNGLNLADRVNQAVEGTPLMGFLSGGDNYAFGGARAGTNGDLIPDLEFQIGAFLLSHLGGADADALYLVNIGGNDARDILIDGLSGVEREQAIADAADAAADAATALQSVGANHLLFVGVPDIGTTPETLALGGSAPADGRQISEDLAAAIFAALPDDVMTFDTLAFFDALPDSGLNTTDACLTSGAADPSGPPTCNDFAFFDTIHPTTAIHALWGAAIVEEFVGIEPGPGSSVPEPGTASLLMLGLAGLTSMIRGRERE